MLRQQSQSAILAHITFPHCRDSGLRIGEIAFHHQVGQHDAARIAHHAVGLVTHQMPYGQFPLLIADVKHGLRDIFLTLGVNQRHQRMSGTVGIP